MEIEKPKECPLSDYEWKQLLRDMITVRQRDHATISPVRYIQHYWDSVGISLLRVDSLE